MYLAPFKAQAKYIELTDSSIERYWLRFPNHSSNIGHHSGPQRASMNQPPCKLQGRLLDKARHKPRAVRPRMLLCLNIAIFCPCAGVIPNKTILSGCCFRSRNALPMASIKRFLITNKMVGRGNYDRGRGVPMGNIRKRQ